MSESPATIAARILRAKPHDLAKRMHQEPGRFIADVKRVCAALVDRQP